MAWWIRPPPRRFWASTKPSPGAPIRWSAGTRQSSKRISAWLPGRPNVDARVGHGRDVAEDVAFRACPSGPTKIDACLWGRFSGLVSANTRMMSATDALVMNHFRPLMTHSSPSSTAVVAMRGGIGPGQERLGQGEGARDLAAQVRPQPALLLFARSAPWASSSMLPLSGACIPKIIIEIIASTDQLRHQRQLHLAESGTAELRDRGRRPTAPRLHLVLQVALDERPLVGGQLGQHRLERNDLAVDESGHPVELRPGTPGRSRSPMPCRLSDRHVDSVTP